MTVQHYRWELNVENHKNKNKDYYIFHTLFIIWNDNHAFIALKSDVFFHTDLPFKNDQLLVLVGDLLTSKTFSHQVIATLLEFN